MPFVQARISKDLSDSEKTALQKELTAIVKDELHKPAGFIMVGIEAGYNLWLGENRLENGAMISVQQFGSANRDAYNAITQRICDCLKKNLGTPSDKVYVTFQSINEWGWNGQLFQKKGNYSEPLLN